MIIIKQHGSFKNTEKFLSSAKRLKVRGILEGYGKRGATALASATPVDTGLTSQSWSYEIITTGRGYTINWTNSNVVNGVPIALVLQYGHGTGTGGYVQGRDYINPAIQPIFDSLAEDLWKEVSKL